MNVFHVAGAALGNLCMSDTLLEKTEYCLLLGASFYISRTVKDLMFYPPGNLRT